jgi:hypothetical protein
VENPTPVISVEPPVAWVEIRQFVPADAGGKLELVDPNALPTIEEDVHERLVRIGMKRYRRLWTALAEK